MVGWGGQSCPGSSSARGSLEKSPTHVTVSMQSALLLTGQTLGLPLCCRCDSDLADPTASFRGILHLPNGDRKSYPLALGPPGSRVYPKSLGSMGQPAGFGLTVVPLV